MQEYIVALKDILNTYSELTIRIPLSNLLIGKMNQAVVDDIGDKRAIISDQLGLNALLTIADGVAQAAPGAAINCAAISGLPTLIQANSEVSPLIKQAGNTSLESFLEKTNPARQAETIFPEPFNEQVIIDAIKQSGTSSSIANLP